MKENIKHNHYTYVALLRGINVGGHKKVPMADLRKALEQAGFKNVRTLLASGNVVFETIINDIDKILGTIKTTLEKTFPFSIPTLLRPFSDIEKIITMNPFRDIVVTSDIRLYVTFISDSAQGNLAIPYTSTDGSYRITCVDNNAVFSVLELGKIKTVDAMLILEKAYGKNITTRNWNTVIKIGKA